LASSVAPGQDRNALDLVAAAAPHVLLGPQVGALEGMVRKGRRLPEAGAARREEVVLVTDELVYLFRRAPQRDDLILVALDRARGGPAPRLPFAAHDRPGSRALLPLPSSASSFERRSATPEGRRRRALFALLHHVEKPGTTGLVTVHRGGRPLGSIMAAHGRLCFAAPTEGHTRIGELLAEDQPEVAEKIDEMVRQARQERRRLCEVILESRALPFESVRQSLCRQTARAVLAIVEAAGGAPPELDVSPARDDYDRRLTFTALEVFLTASGAMDRLPPDLAGEVFSALPEGSDAALLLLRGADWGTLPVPVAARSLGDASLPDIAGVARAASETCRHPALEPARLEPTFALHRMPGAAWLGVVGESRLALLRITGDAAGVLRSLRERRDRTLR
jgi:hypothetical protein